jgi:hypothetical protein
VGGVVVFFFLRALFPSGLSLRFVPQPVCSAQTAMSETPMLTSNKKDSPVSLLLSHYYLPVEYFLGPLYEFKASYAPFLTT